MKSLVKTLALVVLTTCSLASCQTLSFKKSEKASKTEMTSTPLNGTSWILESIGTRNFKKIEGMRQSTIELNFDATENYFNSSDGCNSKGGSFTQNQMKLTLENVRETKMMCAPEVMKNLYVVPFNEVTQFSIEKNQLQLRNASNEVLATYRKK